MTGNESFITRRFLKAGANGAVKHALAAAAVSLPMVALPANADDLDILLRAEEALNQGRETSAANSGVSISVDGDVLVGSPIVQDKIVKVDKALENVDIQVKYDGLDVTRRLNVSTDDLRRTYIPGEVIAFQGSWNYPDWIDRAEIRIFRQVDKYAAEAIAKPLEVVPVNMSGDGGTAVWQSFDQGNLADDDEDTLAYVLRVYDRNGRFDETKPLTLRLSKTGVAVEDRIGSVPVAPGEAEDRTGVSNIPLYGGTITVFGRHVPPGYKVKVLGDEIPVDPRQKFVTSRILPPGDHVVNVAVYGATTKDAGLRFERDINIPDEEWFYVGLADLTIAQRLGEEANLLQGADPEEFGETYERGRLAFYLKGKIKGETLITAAFDTTEDDLDNLFRDLDEKDPRQFLRNLDPDDFYPIYGDDSTIVEDAPTAGKFYLRVERGKNHVLWGNFKTRINDTELLRYERSLYGAHAVAKSDQSTSHGEPIAQVEAFAAEPGSLPQRDEFRGTGGSAYFLRRQDINQGSEQVTIEERDPATGLVVARTLLRPGQDYEFDYVQGVILLNRQLPSTTGSSGSVRMDAIGGNYNFLVTTYEYTPAATDLDGYSYGARGQAWLSDTVRVGATGFVEDTGEADQTAYGADVLVRLSEKSYFEFEWSQSEGDTFDYDTSTDGGLIFSPISGVNATGERAEAYRAKVALDLGEMTGGEIEGVIGGYYEHRDAGFNAPGRYTSVTERLTGVFAEVKATEDTTFRAKYDDVDRVDGSDRTELTAELEHRFNDEYKASVGVTHSDFASGIGSNTGFGQRTDVGGRIERTLENGDRFWVFGQATVDRDETRERNDRVGIGVEAALTDKLSASAEVSYGTQGIGGLAALTYSPNADDKYYFGYRLDPDTTAGDLNGYDPFGRDYGSVLFGANRRLNDQLTVFFEENYDFSGTQQSLTHTYGVTYTPDDAWTISAGIEAGEVYDEIAGDFDRFGVSGTISLREEARQASLRFEARFEDGVNANARDRNTYLLTANYSYKHNDDWRFLAKVDGLLSESDQSTIPIGDYVEASVGWAYRPEDNDRLNALFRYTYLEDLPGPEQVNRENQALGPRQRSHVLEADFIYDVNKHLSIGGKYGFRTGEIETVRGSGNFTNSTAHLAVARADIHVVDKWDVILEARALWLEEADQVNYGYLAGVYRHINDNLKIGVGYNFSDFSDDITDLTYDDEGIFVNVIGKF
ncbi:MAG: TonB-dependent receptor [Rhizobiaceae bacterium]|nr:TonB-dependent receptor [Rhizobiaceae bacterium]